VKGLQKVCAVEVLRNKKIDQLLKDPVKTITRFLGNRIRKTKFQNLKSKLCDGLSWIFRFSVSPSLKWG
jgi:hypothetical protein